MVFHIKRLESNQMISLTKFISWMEEQKHSSVCNCHPYGNVKTISTELLIQLWHARNLCHQVSHSVMII